MSRPITNRSNAGAILDITLSTLEAEIDNALDEAHLPSLALALVHLTGNTCFIDEHKPAYRRFDDDQGNFSEEARARLREEAKRAILGHLQGEKLAQAPSLDTVKRMLNFSGGSVIPEQYLPYILEELKLDNVDPRQPDWSEDVRRKAAGLKVVIIGAGLSGLLSGIRLKQAGIAFEIIEKHSDVGGVWLENTYPGCRVDTPNHMYNYSFVSGYEWPSWFSEQSVLLEYFRHVARHYELYRHIRFETEVVAAQYQETDGSWDVQIRDKDGKDETLRAKSVISAVGQLNQPKYPDIPGIENFTGVAMHSARWRPDVSLEGKRVAVVGTGASAYQIIPEIAPIVKSLVVLESGGAKTYHGSGGIVPLRAA
jgi:4-hydroxyacetophenone monooxygenase